MSVEMSKKPAGKNSNVIVAAVCLAFFTGMIGMADDDRAMKPAKALFAYSLLYLFAIFAAYLADSVVERALAMGGA